MDRCYFALLVSHRLQGLRKLDDTNLAFALGNFELGNAGFGNEVDQRLELSEIHGYFPIVEKRVCAARV